MPVTPTSEIAIATAQLRRMVALSATFRAEGNHTTVAAATESVYTRAVDPALVPRPHAILMPGDAHSFELVAGGSKNWLRQAGSIALYLARDVALEHYEDEVSAGLAAENAFGAILQEVADLSGQDDPESAFERTHLAIVRMSRLAFEPVGYEYQKAQRLFYHAVYLVEWGDGDG